jgi:hypothetical protein
VARGNVVGLERQLEKLKTDATNTNSTLVRLRELERAVDAQKAVYEKFLRDKEQIARLTVDTPAGRVIAPAVAPQRRTWPNRPLILALSLFGGLFLGVALALLFETQSPYHGPLRGRADEDNLLTAKDPFLVLASNMGRTSVKHPPEGVPIHLRTARHVTSVVEVANALTELKPERGIVIEDAPPYEGMVKKGIGTYFKQPT